jgi:hypothetical protein
VPPNIIWVYELGVVPISRSCAASEFKIVTGYSGLVVPIPTDPHASVMVPEPDVQPHWPHAGDVTTVIASKAKPTGNAPACIFSHDFMSHSPDETHPRRGNDARIATAGSSQTGKDIVNLIAISIRKGTVRYYKRAGRGQSSKKRKLDLKCVLPRGRGKVSLRRHSLRLRHILPMFALAVRDLARRVWFEPLSG